MKQRISESREETIDLGYKIGSLLQKGVILLDGELASGKTTLTKGIGKALKVKGVINSPTFTIMKQYYNDENIPVLYHFDLYRLDQDAQDDDFFDYFNQDKLVVVEWPFQVEHLLPDQYLLIKLRVMGEEKRLLEISALGEIYENVVRQL